MPKRLPKPEFIALMAMMFATIAFSIDSMLPALPEIAADLSPDTPNHAQLILTSFVLGMGIGTLFTGPLSDAFGRRPVILAGAAVYIVAALVASQAESLELLLVARVVQGLGCAAPRVVALAIIRDLYEGRGMAQLSSFVMMVFTLVPAIAPTIGAGIMEVFGWRAIFVSFVGFSVVSMLWLFLRQSETHPPERRRAFRPAVLWSGVVEVVSNRQVALVIVALSLCFGALFAILSTIQPIFDVTFGEAERFHWWFMLIALISAGGSFVNARIVMTLGIRRVLATSFAAQVVMSAVMVILCFFVSWDTNLAFVAFVIWVASVFVFMAQLAIGNLNALGLAPMGHIAGMAASIIAAVATVVAVAIAVPVGLSFDGTPFSAALGVLICATGALMIVRKLGDPSLDTPHDPSMETGT